MRPSPLARFAWSPLFQIHDELARAFDGARALIPARELPPLSVYTSDEGLRVVAEVPGLSAEQVDVSVEADRLTISGTFPEPVVPEGFSASRRERRSGAFSRTIALPFRVDAEGVRAQLKDGLLELHVPRAEDERPRRIEVRAS